MITNISKLNTDVYHITDTMKHKAAVLNCYANIVKRFTETGEDNFLYLLLDLENAPLDTSAAKALHYENADELIAEIETNKSILNALRENDQIIFYKYCEEMEIPVFMLEPEEKYRIIFSIINTNMCIHDDSKLFNMPEYNIYKDIVPKFKGLEYGTPEHKKVSDELDPGFKYHYEANPHHPEHFDMDIKQMSLFSILEMVLDWCAACICRGFVFKMSSVDKKKVELKLDDEMVKLIKNTIRLCLDPSQISENE